MLDLLDLIKLQDLGNPFFAWEKLLLSADLQDLFTKGMKVDWEVVNTREDIGEEATRG
jgi:hypothetical protein